MTNETYPAAGSTPAAPTRSLVHGPPIITQVPHSPPTVAKPDGAAVRLEWPDGSTVRLPYLWLRDHCPCSECQVIEIGEHRVIIGNQPEDLAANTATIVESDSTTWALDVTWPDHASTFSCTDLQRLVASSQRGQRRVTTWSSDFAPDRFDHDAVITDQATAKNMWEAFAEFGAVVVTGTPTEPGTVEEFISRFMPVREMPFGRVHDVAVNTRAYNVAHTAEALPPHNDFASMSWPASGQALHMLTNETDGGDSIIVDGWRLAEEFRAAQPESFEVLSRVPVGFRMFSDTVETWTRQPLIRCDSEGNVSHFRYSNQLIQPLDPQHPDLDSFYKGYHAICRAVVDPTNQVRFRLEAGHMLLVHGHRVLHGRTAFSSGGARHLQDTYFDFDDVLAPLTRPD